MPSANHRIPDPGRLARGRGDVVRNPLAGGRETVESIVVAFTLALLFRAFEAEAFVIPTGSMAPTLMGRHKDLDCPACGATLRVGASQEWDEAAGRIRPDKLVPAATCFNCGDVIPLARGPGQPDPRYPSFNGDRILVDKFAYDFGEPERWDVVVFKYPEDAKINYIKRLVGLPGESLFIAGGDIWTAREGAEPEIARKPPQTLRAMLQCVHDADRVAEELVQAGWPTAWADWSSDAERTCRWSSDDDGRSFSASCPPDSSAELRFRNIVPTADDWRTIGGGGRPRPPEASPIVDVQPYNTMPGRLHHVGDLAVELSVESRQPQGRLALDLVENGARHVLEVDLADGTARIDVPGGAAATARTAIRGRGTWRLCFANVDDELSLTVNGRRVEFDASTAWRRPMPAAGAAPVVEPAAPGSPGPSDLAPVGVRLTGGDVRLSRLRVLRDVYYISMVDVARDGRPIEEDVLEFPLADGQYFMLGDNSAASKDSRLWLDGHHVDRRLLIGKALVVFWPHAVPAPWGIPLRFGGWDLRLPSWPNFARMRFVR
ncbi:MAG: signal peptidase I [Planctomycetes bacterium]|nr:signal peptidase I [Planctomycetota bacterium]